MTTNYNHIKPIQIIGTQRSGSNLLRLILNQSPEIAAPHPPHILDTMLPLIHKYGSLSDHANFLSVVNDVCRLIEVNPVKWEIDLDRNQIALNCNHRSLPEIFRVIYSCMAIKKRAKYWCCKSMANVKYFSLIEGSGITPYYIHLIRDGRDVAASFKKILVGEKHPYHLAVAWRSNYLRAIEIEQEIGYERFITVKYETLISDPEKIIQQLNERLNVNLTTSALDFFHSEESKKTAQAGFMWRNVTNPIISFNHGQYTDELSLEEVEIFERVAGDILLQNDYKLHSKLCMSEFSSSEIAEFELTNQKLKEEISSMKHLQLDKEFRSDRQNLLEELRS